MTAPVRHWWRLLGRTDEVSDVRPVGAGASGATVYRLRAGGRDLVLKTTRHTRELRFHRELAAGVPVRVPRLVAAADGCLLFECAGTPARPDGWPTARWCRLATELGTLHRARVPALPWLKPASRPASVTAARRTWAGLGYPDWPDVAELDAALRALPYCLLHGDWHLGNVLTGPAGFVWIDWQEVGSGHGPEDLALLWQRAEADGWTPPRAAMRTAYAAARGIADDQVLRRATGAAELLLLLLDWPDHLRTAPAPVRTRLLRRLVRLLADWD